MADLGKIGLPRAADADNCPDSKTPALAV